MNETQQLLKTLKQCLRNKGLTYKDVAQALSLSEASVKRLFAEQSFSLQRLEQLCKLIDSSIYELARLAAQKQQATTTLSLEQETALADDPLLLTYFYLLLNGWLPEQICQDYEVQSLQGIRLLSQLDKLRLIELLPGNKVRLLTARTINWQPNGPVRRLYEQQAKLEFLNYDFEQHGWLLRLATGQLSMASSRTLQRKTERLLKEFDELAELDLSLPLAEKQSMGLLLSFRPWVFSMIAERRKDHFQYE